MEFEVINLYDTVETTPLPKRSQFYFLEPIGIGSPYVESLTGYQERLSEAHCIYPGTLINKILVPILEKKYLLKYSKECGGEGFYKDAHILNGLGNSAKEFILAMESITQRNDLRYLTLLTYSEVLTPRGLIRKAKAWCPSCYEEWRVNKQVIYQPLIWTLQVVKRCPKHFSSLKIQCPYEDCNKELFVLNRRSRPGYCTKCNRWLGCDPIPHTEDSEAEKAWQNNVNENIGQLLARTPFISPPKKENVLESITACTNNLFKGNIAAFARAISIPKNTFWGWYKGKNIPSIEMILRICYCLGMPLVDFLAGKTLNLVPKQYNRFKGSNQPIKRSISHFDCIKSEEVLKEHLSSNKEIKPLKDIAQQLGVSKRTLYNYFPELCHSISNRHSDNQEELKKQRIAQDSLEVKNIVLKLNKEAIYPSRRMVEKFASKPAILREKAIQTAWKELLSNKNNDTT